ncbi:DUF3107 domain-containing protein [Solicola gregarius]|uniref:DUF3107 domain-containing protein n=1 Tax=Solicola gregarius TaxID=2908642 RepID=A0AA46TJA6_9ACTN|nr:DUF3107 domain-containing protein [Solicola gregarius]UYM06140.1 DUF3107 domain-containing protein [Solicola gregarius]
MEVRIGVQHAPREITIDAAQSRDEVLAAVRAATSGDELLELSDDRGRVVAIPIARIAYIEFDAEDGRRVGFGE